MKYEYVDGGCGCGGAKCRLDVRDERHGTTGGYTHCRCRCQDCREAKSKHGRRYREENREKELERHRRWYEENREEESERKRRWYEENREKVSERYRRYYEENREKVSERQRRYYEENREEVLECHRRYREENRGYVNSMKASKRATYASITAEHENPALKGQPYTPAEDALIRRHRAEGMRALDIAIALGRGYGSVQSRIRLLRNKGQL